MENTQEIPVTISEIQQASALLAGNIVKTPIRTCRFIDQLLHASVVFKCEHEQIGGAFKARGALYATKAKIQRIKQKGYELPAGVVTHSSGNHGIALSIAAAKLGLRAIIVMPKTAPLAKQSKLKALGARLIFCEPTLASREEAVAALMARENLLFIPPYDDWDVITGQGTVALEFLGQQPDLDMLLVPVGGGGLISGVSIAAHGMSRGVRIVGAEPEEANDAARGLSEGRRLPPTDRPTVADGLRAALSDKTFAVIQKHVNGVWTASEDEIRQAWQMLQSECGFKVEPSSAVALAALIKNKFNLLASRAARIGVILTGGNYD